MIDSEKIRNLQHTILSRYEQHARELPRRTETDPYKIRVSEVMSQQTQVSRVITKYHAWMETLPTLSDLAHTDKHTLLSLRSGLGYNNRALRLQRAAQIIMSDYDGVFPRDEKTLLSLPGIGPYTAHAIMAFAFNIEAPVLDINIKRVLITLLDLPRDSTDRELRDIAIVCIPPGQSKLRHNALMDYGALVLTAKKTGIKSATQSTFKGSRRWVRGSIMKELVEHHSVSAATMNHSYPHDDFDAIIQDMIRDGLISLDQDTITLQG